MRQLLAALGLALLAGACAAVPSPSPSRPAASPGPSPTPVDARPDPSGLAGCAPTDLLLEHGVVEGAAGSRYTRVTLRLVGEAAACSIPGRPEFSVLDASGALVIGFTAGGEVDPADVVPGDTLVSDLKLTNWCQPPPAQPVTLILALAAGTVGVSGSPFPGPDELPPCMGGSGVDASATSWTGP